MLFWVQKRLNSYYLLNYLNPKHFSIFFNLNKAIRLQPRQYYVSLNTIAFYDKNEAFLNTSYLYTIFIIKQIYGNRQRKSKIFIENTW
jgi:hypothetical protein